MNTAAVRVYTKDKYLDGRAAEYITSNIFERVDNEFLVEMFSKNVCTDGSTSRSVVYNYIMDIVKREISLISDQIRMTNHGLASTIDIWKYEFVVPDNLPESIIMKEVERKVQEDMETDGEIVDIVKNGNRITVTVHSEHLCSSF